MPYQKTCLLRKDVFCTTEGIDKVIPLSAFRCSCFENGYGMLMVDGPLKGLLARGVDSCRRKPVKFVYEELVSEITNEPNYEAAIASLKTNKVDYCFSLVKVKG